MSQKPRVRFAPSPTGYLHVGGARTALFNWLYARHTGGTFVLRVEDTDDKRNTEEAVQVIYDGLRWLGLDWDEGPLVGGERGPYFQSQRNAIYERYLEQLRAAGHLYEDGGAVRFRSPRQTVQVVDIVCGTIDFDLSNPETHPDMTIRRPDGSWIFHFVNVVDDIEMGITHVIRGEDHLSNTPKHVELYNAFGVRPPIFAHIPLILKKDGKGKMSKRDEGSAVASYITDGYAPEAVRNYLCLLGWSPKDNREKIDIAEVVQLFDLDKINRGNAAFDLEKCAWLSGEYFREMDPARFRELGREALVRAGVDLARFDAAYVDAALDTCRGKVRLLKELPAYAGFYFRDERIMDEAARTKFLTPEALPRLAAMREALGALTTFDAAAIEGVLKPLAAQYGVKLGAFLQPLRVAVTGSAAGPSLYHLLEILGRERVLRLCADV
ncbi:MAG: glutamate--tRNA ligase [Verrucomicrobia bacterium]|nr:glutamate--tRNA ligase [Verrucomicrobiota bacterium]